MSIVYKQHTTTKKSPSHKSRIDPPTITIKAITMGETDSATSSDSINWTRAILSTLQGAGSSSEEKDDLGKVHVKRLRRMVLLSLQMDESKKSKKRFKKTIQSMEGDGSLTLNEEGIVTLKKRKVEHKKKKKKEKSNKRQKTTESHEPAAEDESNHTSRRSLHSKNDETEQGEKNGPLDSIGTNQAELKNKPCKGNPQGITRLFLGNLPFAVDEQSLGGFLPGDVTHIKWITDKETGKFYGSAFCEMATSIHAAESVAKAGSDLMGRPIKINFAPARPGDVWPPEKKVSSGGGGGGSAKKTGIKKEMSEKPENCVKLFIGNLSYDIDDDAITKFFANVEAEVKAVRWLHHRDSGDFKGCGYVDFWNTEACEKAATLNGKSLLGRPIRIDWAD